MAKRGYKLQEFVAHGSDVNCLNIGKKSCRIFLTGGQDSKVNLWEVGKPISILSLSGHTSSVQSVNFDSTEVLVLAGSSNGTIKLWDLEEAKLVRTVTGHRSNCTAVEFHPFGEFFASGSSDTDLRIWDIRKKGCIHTYKGHTRGLRTIKFTPDGRWVVTGGDDHVVKVWDLTAGKLLHDFKFHNGIIRCIDFHPQEFLLATGSADRTVNFWDLETFELIGSAGPEETGVRSMVFHPDGRTLFCGLDEILKVFSWEPIRCHDSVEMGWSTLGDLSIYEGKVLGCSYHQNRVGVWVADISLIGPYADGVMPKKNLILEPIKLSGDGHPFELKGGCTNSSMTLIAGSPESGGKIKDAIGGSPNLSNACSQEEEDSIYSSKSSILDSSGPRRNTVIMSSQDIPQKLNSRFASKVSTGNSGALTVSKSTKISTPNIRRKTESNFASREMPMNSTTSGANSRLRVKRDTIMLSDTVNTSQTPVFVPRESLEAESVAYSQKGTETTKTVVNSTASGNLHDVQQPSFSGRGRNSQMGIFASRPSSSPTEDTGSKDSNFIPRMVVNDETVRPYESNTTSIRHVAKKFERSMSLEQPMQDHNDQGEETPCSSNDMGSVKYVRGVAVPLGKTRSLVERWEKRERCDNSYIASITASSGQVTEPDNLPHELNVEAPITSTETKEDDSSGCESLVQGHDVFTNVVKSRLTKLQVVRHFWERKGIKGAIDAVVKLPDYSIQVDVIGVLMEKTNLLTLDIFSCLLPLLSGLLNSRTERHVTISLEMLFELIKIFGPIIHLSITASSSVGVDLQAEQRLDRCKKCYIHLQKIRQILPMLIRNGGLAAKHAQKLNVALSEL